MALEKFRSKSSRENNDCISIRFENEKLGIMPSDLKQENRAQLLRDERRKSKKDKDREDQEKFDHVLNRCLVYLASAMDSGHGIFELLDPLISDTQCHIHTVLILDTLRKCYDGHGSIYYGIENLEDKDKKILSYAVLFSLFKIDCIDEFGLGTYQAAICNFNCTLLPSLIREKHCFIEAKKSFNSYSVDYIKSVARSEAIKEILTECEAELLKPRLRLLPTYASMYAVIDYIRWKKLPIIVSLVNIKRQVLDGVVSYNLNKKYVHFYEFREEENDFFFKQDLSDSEKTLPTIAFRCYSLSKNETQELPITYDIRDLVMLFASRHVQLPKNAKLPAEYDDGDEYVRSVYKKHADFFHEYNKYCELGQRLHVICTPYARAVNSSKSSRIVERRAVDALFDIGHVHLSNYSHQYERLESLDVSSQVDQSKRFDINVNETTSEVLRRLFALDS